MSTLELTSIKWCWIHMEEIKKHQGMDNKYEGIDNKYEVTYPSKTILLR